MQLQFNNNCSQLKQIGKSNNSHIYKEVNEQGVSNGQALKLILHSEKGKHSKECNHLKNEYQILSKLNHPNIIGVKNQFQQDAFLGKHQLCAIEIELADQDLFDKMSSMYPKVLSPNQIRALFLQILRAIEYLHSKNIAHNDIKLDNVFLFQQQELAKIADFGFAKEQSSNQSLESQFQDWKHRCKTMLAPELLQFIASQDLSKASSINEFKTDIWAIGVTLFQALYLRTPFAGDFPSANDSMFAPLYSKNFSDFWKNSEISNISAFLEKQERISIKQIINHPWFQAQSNSQSSQSSKQNNDCNIF